MAKVSSTFKPLLAEVSTNGILLNSAQALASSSETSRFRGSSVAVVGMNGKVLKKKKMNRGYTRSGGTGDLQSRTSYLLE